MAAPTSPAPHSPSDAGATQKQRTLVLIRHGHAVQGAEDEVRRLSEEGKRQLAQLALKLRTLPPQRFLCSSATRTRQSAEILKEKATLAAELELQSDLYLASPQAILDSISQTSVTTAVCWVVGHNPGLSELVRLIGPTLIELSTGQAAILRFRGEWRELRNCPCEVSDVDDLVQQTTRAEQ